MRFWIQTFGCQMNEADSEEIRRYLFRRGGRPAGKMEEADLIIVNTCTVRHHAEERAMSYIGRLAQWRRADPRRRIAVVGCAAERLGENIRRRLPFVDRVIGAKSQEQIGKLLDGFLTDEVLHTAADDISRGFDWFRESEEAFTGAQQARPDGEPFRMGRAPVSAFVTIMRGCNYSCSYCIVPFVRGREVYRPPETVLQEVRDRIAEGAREIVLLGQTVNSYRAPFLRPDEAPPAIRNGPLCTFEKLLRAVGEIPGVERIRFFSPHPHYFRPEVIAAMAEVPAVCPHVHLPAQSGSDRILKRMRRNYTRRQYLDLVRRLRQARPEIAVTTDLIVGFCGETEEDFRQTLSLVEEAGLDDAFTFLYSPRPGTEAAAFPDDVPAQVKKERLARLNQVVNQQARRMLRRWVGTVQPVLVEDSDGTSASGRTPQNRPVKILAGGFRPGEIVSVRISEAIGRTLLAERKTPL